MPWESAACLHYPAVNCPYLYCVFAGIAEAAEIKKGAVVAAAAAPAIGATSSRLPTSEGIATGEYSTGYPSMWVYIGKN